MKSADTPPISRSIWLSYSPIGGEPGDRLGCLKLIAEHHAREGNADKAGYWEGTLQVQIEGLFQTTGKHFTVEVAEDADLPDDRVIAAWMAEWHADREETRAKICERHVRQLHDEDPEILKNVYGVDSPEPYARHARTARHGASRLRTKATRARRTALRPRSATTRPRAPRAATTRSCRSRNSPSGDSDPPDGDGESEPPGVVGGRECLAPDCDKSLADKAPQSLFCSDACRKRDERARKERDRLALEAWQGRQQSAPAEPLPEFRRSPERCSHALTLPELETTLRAALEGYDLSRAIHALQRWKVSTYLDCVAGEVKCLACGKRKASAPYWSEFAKTDREMRVASDGLSHRKPQRHPLRGRIEGAAA